MVVRFVFSIYFPYPIDNTAYLLYNISKDGNGSDFFYDHAGVACMTYRGTTQVWYRRDAQGNVIALVENGTVVARYVYDAWGNHKVLDANYNEITDTSHIGHINPIRYRGYYYDSETGLYYCNARYYDPTTGRFISADDISYLDPETINGLNLFSYCGNNPVMNVDPSGHIVLSIGLLMAIGFGVGAIIGAGTSVVGQFIANGWSWDNFSWGQLALDTVLGGVSGLLSMSPLSLGAMVAVNAGLGFIGAIGGHLINGSDFSKGSTWLDITLSTALGALVGLIGRAGALNSSNLNKAAKTAEFLRAAGMYDDVLTKATTGFYRTSGIATNALRLSHNNLVKHWNKMVINQASKSLTKALLYGGATLLLGTMVKGLLYNWYNNNLGG